MMEELLARLQRSEGALAYALLGCASFVDYVRGSPSLRPCVRATGVDVAHRTTVARATPHATVDASAEGRYRTPVRNRV